MSDGIGLGFARVRTETEKAVLFDTAEHGALWIPQSAIHDDSETWNLENPSGKLVVEEWFAEKRGLV